MRIGLVTTTLVRIDDLNGEIDMAKRQVQTKTNWKDIGDLRLPNSQWRLGKAARWFEERLGLPRGTVAFVRPSGKKARPDKTLKALKAEWAQSLL